MSKRDNKQTAAEDYLSQLDWQSRRARRKRVNLGSSDEPNWKYQPMIKRGWVASPITRFLVIGGFLVATGYYFYQGIFLGVDLSLYIGIVFLVIAIIIFLAARDASKPTDHESDG